MVRPQTQSLSYSPTIDCPGNSLLGPIIYFRLFYKKIIVLNSGKVALDILEGRSAIYSDRPMNWMAGEIAGRKRSVFFMSLMDPDFKISRRLLQTVLNTRASKSYRPIQIQETQTFKIWQIPQRILRHISEGEDVSIDTSSACMIICWEDFEGMQWLLYRRLLTDTK